MRLHAWRTRIGRIWRLRVQKGMSDNPVVALNHAIAGDGEGPQQGLDLLRGLDADARLAGHTAWTPSGTPGKKLGTTSGAIAHYRAGGGAKRRAFRSETICDEGRATQLLAGAGRAQAQARPSQAQAQAQAKPASRALASRAPTFLAHHPDMRLFYRCTRRAARALRRSRSLRPTGFCGPHPAREDRETPRTGLERRVRDAMSLNCWRDARAGEIRISVHSRDSLPPLPPPPVWARTRLAYPYRALDSPVPMTPSTGLGQRVHVRLRAADLVRPPCAATM